VGFVAFYEQYNWQWNVFHKIVIKYIPNKLEKNFCLHPSIVDSPSTPLFWNFAEGFLWNPLKRIYNHRGTCLPRG
jgi:hypothetical protein